MQRIVLLIVFLGSLGAEARANEAAKLTITPFLTYRYAGLARRFDSPYHDTDHKDSVDQIYASVNFKSTADYVHQAVVEAAFRTVRNNPGEEEGLFEQAYIDSQPTSFLVVTAGKKTELEGSGMVATPSDLLNEDKELFDSLYQREGKVFMRLRLTGEDKAISTGFIPRRTRSWKSGKLWNQANIQFFDTDIRLQHTYTDHDKSTLGLSLSRIFFDTIETHFDGRYQARQRDPEDSSDKQLAFLRESSYERKNPSGFYLGGVRYIITPRRTFIAEYIVQESGLHPAEFETMHTKYLETKAVEETPTRLQGRRYAFASLQDDDTFKDLHMAFTHLVNTDDQSTFSTVTIRRHLSNVAAVELTPTFFKGKKFSEFGAMPFSEAYYLTIKGRF